MSPFQQTILNEVRRRGRVTFSEFMGWALYHPQNGYYTAGPARTGRRGDFFTSVQGGDLLGRLLAESFCEMWDTLGSGRLTLVELGAGDGALAEQVLKALEEKGRASSVTFYLVEKSVRRREEARRRLSRFSKIHILDDLTSLEHTAGIEGCIYSNEFFDALPFHRVQGPGESLCELYVEAQGDRLVERPFAPSTPRLARGIREQGVSLVEGQKAEICLLLDDVVAEIDRVLARGFVLTIDYGEPSLDLYRETRLEGTLQIYQRHQLMDNPFDNIGERDITAFVDFGRLATLGNRGELKPLIFASQGTYLLNSAEALLRHLVEEDVGRQGDTRQATAIQQLLHPESLGGRFHVLLQGKNVGTPTLSGGRVNRIRRLCP
jgi:SAM-dependent MidA family methyltransferase